MALTYAQLDTLTTTDAFLGRVREALRYKANYILTSQSPTQSDVSWSNTVFYEGRCYSKAAAMAGQLVQDAAFTGAVQPDASDITDSALQDAVNKICMGY